jgi:hypothetical protein
VDVMSEAAAMVLTGGWSWVGWLGPNETARAHALREGGSLFSLFLGCVMSPKGVRKPFSVPAILQGLVYTRKLNRKAMGTGMYEKWRATF